MQAGTIKGWMCTVHTGLLPTCCLPACLYYLSARPPGAVTSLLSQLQLCVSVRVCVGGGWPRAMIHRTIPNSEARVYVWER